MAAVKRFAGFPSPRILVGDPLLTREEKIDALEGWRSLVAREGAFDQEDPGGRRRLIGEISRALEVLVRH